MSKKTDEELLELIGKPSMTSEINSLANIKIKNINNRYNISDLLVNEAIAFKESNKAYTPLLNAMNLIDKETYVNKIILAHEARCIEIAAILKKKEEDLIIVSNCTTLKKLKDSKKKGV